MGKCCWSPAYMINCRPTSKACCRIIEVDSGFKANVFLYYVSHRKITSYCDLQNVIYIFFPEWRYIRKKCTSHLVWLLLWRNCVIPTCMFLFSPDFLFFPHDLIFCLNLLNFFHHICQSTMVLEMLPRREPLYTKHNTWIIHSGIVPNLEHIHYELSTGYATQRYTVHHFSCAWNK